MENERRKATRIESFREVDPPEPQMFRFDQNGKSYEIPYWPLTAPQVEAVRASIPKPEPPSKPLPGKGGKDLAHLSHEGFPTTFRDLNDPEYLKAIERHNAELNLEFVRVAMRHGKMPTDPDATPEATSKDRDDFRTEVRDRLTAGNYSNLVEEIIRHTFTLSQGMIEGFFGNFAQRTPTDEAS